MAEIAGTGVRFIQCINDSHALNQARTSDSECYHPALGLATRDTRLKNGLRVMIRILTLLTLFAALAAGARAAGGSVSPQGARLYIQSPADGAVVDSPEGL